MIENLAEYFLQEQEFYLQNISYNRINKYVNKEEYSLNCIDNIQVDVNDNEGVRITVTRSLHFEPEELFILSVSFGAILRFVEDRKSEYNWHEINLAEEFRNYGAFATNNLMSRISLLIAQITSSFGQLPLILPPSVAQDNKDS